MNTQTYEEYKKEVEAALQDQFLIGINDIDERLVEFAYAYNASIKTLMDEIHIKYDLDRKNDGSWNGI